MKAEAIARGDRGKVMAQTYVVDVLLAGSDITLPEYPSRFPYGEARMFLAPLALP